MIALTDLNWTFLEIIYLLMIFGIGIGSTYLIIPKVIEFMKNKGYVGYDIHKNARPAVAESGGLSILIGFSICLILLMIFFPAFLNELSIFFLTVISAGIIGFIDDRLKLRSGYKIFLTLLTGGIIFFANYINFIHIQTPTIPFLGQLRITLIYPLAIPLIVAIFANTVNMLEGYNGEGSGTCLIATCFLFVCGIIFNSAQGVIFSIPVIAVLIPFFLFNKFPARVFPGDIGTLSMGAMIACIALFGSLEVAAFCVLLIHIFNSFYMISSVKGFSESSDIHSTRADIILLKDDRIQASVKKDAALTLPRLILARGPLTESQLTKNFFAISVICGFFSIFMTLLMLFTKGTLDLSSIIIAEVVFLLIFTFPSVLILYHFPRIRGVILLMLILLSVGSAFLIFISLVILPINFPDLNLGFIQIPLNLIFSFILVVPALLVWYYITVKYFWYQINKMKRKESIKK